MGNIVGGYMAKLMGVPLGKLCSGVNINDITHRVMQTGKFHKSQAMEKTLSEAINIQLVRVYYVLGGKSLKTDEPYQHSMH
jgi:threonine synthase